MQKEKQNRKVAFIYTHKCHSVSLVFADSIKAEKHKLNKLSFPIISNIIQAFYLSLKIPSYDIYFIESASSLFVPIFKRWFGQKNIIIFRANDGLFGEKSEAYLYSKSSLKRVVLKFLIKHIDGASTESNMSKKKVLNWINIPVEVNESYFENRGMLLKNKPNFKAKRFLFMGEKRPFDHKGVDILIDAFKLLEKEDIELYLIGKNTDKLETPKNVKCIGFAKDISSYLSESCFFIEPAKYETGPITIFESMMAGIIPIFSNNCGHIDCVQQLDNDLVLTSIKPNDVAQKIRQFVKWDEKKLKTLSIKARKLIKDKYIKKDQVIKFKRSFWKLIKRIEERNKV